MSAAIRRIVVAAPFRALSVRRLAAHAVQVPSLGDSVPNGTILTLSKAAGEAVNVDDVIAVIETDKVTVDIRAEVSGVMAKYSVSEGEDVDVGAEIGVIDTEGEPTAAPAKAEAPAPSPSPAPAPAPSPAPSPAAPAPDGPGGRPAGRKPLIQFRHGRANREALAEEPRSSSSPAAAAAAPQWDDAGLEFAKSTATESAEDLPSFFGRPRISEREMEAVLMGGEA